MANGKAQKDFVPPSSNTIQSEHYTQNLETKLHFTSVIPYVLAE
jgi:hypothetical protein